MEATRSQQRGWKLALLSFGLAVAGALAMLFLPLGEYVRGSTERVETGRFNLLESEGWTAVGIAAIPVAIGLLTLPFRRGREARTVRVGAAVLLSAFVLFGLVTIGLLFVPAAAAMWFAAFL